MHCGHDEASPVPGCKFCRAVAKDGRYAELFRNPPPAAAAVAGRPPLREEDVPCDRRGNLLEPEDRCCWGTGGVFECDLHEKCVLTAVPGLTKRGFPACDLCPDRPVERAVRLTVDVTAAPPVPALALAPPPPPDERPGGRCVASCAVGPVGRSWLAVTGPLFERYAARVGARYEVLTGPDADPYPLRHKFKLAELLDRYDRVVYLDADVVLGPDCPDLFAEVPETHVGALDEWPWLGRPAWVQAEVEAVAAAAGLPPPGPLARYFNTGVLVLSAAHRGAVEPPPVPIPHLHCAEQHHVNLRLAALGLPTWPLPLRLHWHPWADPARAHTAGVQVWHFAAEPDRPAKLAAKAAELYPPGR